ncbi:chromosome segregation protein SMC [Candidatus Kapabacteria bacterium]|nr:chromosome segregation protein SMC [Candidatus Kapabacteria bacterium]
MFLSELDIIGFKSFGIKTKFTFSEGITCLVGPNGCGKSNIVDAIRWVLGEQKSNVLRSDNMENIIFNGTKHRKQSGIAEVVLTIENNKQLLPSEFQNVSVARRINRNGDSKYLLNKANCRLKDINNLFMDTGMGPDSYSVIELKMVENLLSGRNEDRKNLLEEAAGITKYKVRRKESERKLKRVEEDLERVEDIVVEVRKNVNSLSRQAAKTRRYNKFTEELKENEIQLYAIDIRSLNKNLSIVETNIADLNLSSEKINKLFEGLAKDLSDKNVQKKEIDDKNKDLRIKISTIQAKLSDSKQLLAVSEVKEKNIKREIERYLQEKESSINSNRKKEDRINQISIEKEDIYKEKDSVIKQINSQKEIEKKIEINSKEIKIEIDSLNQQINKFRSNISELKFKKNRYDDNVQKNDNQIKEIERKINEQNNGISNFENEINSLNISISQQSKVRDKLEVELEVNSNKITTIKEELEILHSQLNDSKSQLNEFNRELSFWESSVDKSSNSGFLLSSKWNDNYNTLAAIMGVDSKYILAFQSVLDKFSDSIVLDNIEKAFDAGKILNEAKKGKQSFILTDKIVNTNKQPEIDGIIAFISELPRVPDNIRNYLRNAFGNIALVENINVGIDLVSSGKIAKAVTLEGDIFTSNGEIILGGIEKAKSDFGKIEKIEKLNKSIVDVNDEINSKRTQISEKSELLNSININSIKQKLNSSKVEITNNERKLSKINIDYNSIKNKVEIFTENLQKALNERTELSGNKVSLEQVSNLENEISKIENEIKQKNKSNHGFELELVETRKKLQTLHITSVNLNNKINNLENEKINITNSIEANKRRLNKSEKDYKSNIDVTEQISNDASLAKVNIAKYSEEIEYSKTESEVLVSKLKEINLELEQLEKEKNNTNSEINSLNSKLHKAEIELTEIKTKIESILNNSSEKYELDLDKLVEIQSNIPAEELREIIKDLKQKLSSIGNVNFMALEDYEVENQRLMFYETQIDDLSKAKNTLLTTIKEVNKTAEELLTSTFEKVRINFKELFQTLFNEEGECDISLDGENPLDADLSIMAKPPGKKPHSIDMLSGGEKTLTAIALLFAIYLVKPSPFCILDEVDAPLDDNNIGRYVNLIKKFSNNTQFLVVTHNKKTMEAADNLYGITQQEEGLSKIVSVQLNRNN